MRESVDFIKIKDYAVINLNNMIPIPQSQIVEIDIDKEKDSSYRYLLQAESREINRKKIEYERMQRLCIAIKSITAI